jgi:phosphohistidine phosphatase
LSGANAVPTLARTFEIRRLRLLLLRHAKSDWSGKSQDHERPLAARGKKAAPQIGAYMRANGYQPALVLCSTAVRAKQTLELIVLKLEDDPETRFDRALYLAEWPRLMTEIQDAPASATPLMLVGHNPGLEQLANALALQSQSGSERERAQKMAHKFPTAALAVLDFDIADWSEVRPGTGRLSDFVRPRDLRSGAAE